MCNYVRFFNADCMGRTVLFYSDDNKISENVEFGNFGKYIKVENEKASFGAKCNSCNDNCSKLELSFENSSVYTIAAICVGSDVCLYGIREIFNDKTKTGANLRVCNLCPDIAGDDLYMNRYKILGDMEYLEVSKYIKVVPDTYDFTVKDKKDIKFNAGKQTLQKGKYNTFYFIGNQKNKPEMKCIVSVDAMSYDTAEL